MIIFESMYYQIFTNRLPDLSLIYLFIYFLRWFVFNKFCRVINICNDSFFFFCFRLFLIFHAFFFQESAISSLFLQNLATGGRGGFGAIGGLGYLGGASSSLMSTVSSSGSSSFDLS